MSNGKEDEKPTSGEIVESDIAKLWELRYRKPTLSGEQLRVGLDELTTELSKAAEGRGFKPLLTCCKEDLEYLHLIDGGLQKEIFDRIKLLMDQEQVNPYDEVASDTFYRRELPKMFQEAIRGGVVVAAGTTVAEIFFLPNAKRLGISLREYKRRFGLTGYRGLVIADREVEPSSRLHEYTHVRDYSIRPYDYLGYPSTRAAYELITNIRAVAVAPALLTSFHPIYHQKLQPENPRTNMAVALTRFRSNQRELNILAKAISKIVKCSQREAIDAMGVAFDYAIECESKNKPIGDEIRSDVLSMWV